MIKRWVRAGTMTPELAARWADEDRWLSEHAVYFIQFGAGGLIKIGTTKNIDKRMKDLQANAPLPLRLIGWTTGGYEEETRLHKLFVDSLAWGEWYRPTEDVLTYVANKTQLGGRPPAPRPTAQQQSRIDRLSSYAAEGNAYRLDGKSVTKAS